MSDSEFDVIIFVESSLHPGISNAEFSNNNFDIFRSDRSDRPGGGTMIATRKCFHGRLLTSSNDFVYKLFIECDILDKKVILGSVYIPPSAPLDCYESVCHTVDSFYPLDDNTEFILTGDFNLPHIHWYNTSALTYFATDDYTLPSNYSAAYTLCNYINFFNFKQHNFITNSDDNTLDLIFSTFDYINVNNEPYCIEPLDSYHPSLSFILNVEFTTPPAVTYVPYLDFKAADYIAINSFLHGVPWEEVLNLFDMNAATNYFSDIMHFIFENFIPHKIKKIDSFPPWYDGVLKSMIYEKKKAHTVYKSTHRGSDYDHFASLRAKIKSYSAFLYNNYLNKIESSIARDKKFFFNYVNNLKTCNDLPANMHLDGTSASTPQEIATLFANYFASVFEVGPSPVNVEFEPYLDSACDLSNISISVEELFDNLLKLNINKGPGYDNIPNTFLTGARCGLTKPLWILFNKSLSEGVFPSIWKNALVRPIYKSGDKADIKNYRPIAILNSIPKLFEKIVCDKLRPIFDSQLSNAQHGFRPGRSTSTNLALFSDYLFSNLDQRRQVDVIYTDFAKAFDKVDHSILLSKLHLFGISGALYNWISDYLQRRTYVVELEPDVSSSYEGTSGVPQGSYLGPPFFNVFIDDLVLRILFAFLLLYADDAKLFHCINSIEDSELLQNDLDEFSDWCSDNRLSLSVPKCRVVRYTTKRSIVRYNYNFDGVLIHPSDEIKDLGVVFTADGTFHKHVNMISSTAFKILGFINRNSAIFKSPYTYRLLYITLVRPKLEYASVIWSPYAIYDSKSIERIQHKFLRNFMYRCKQPMHAFNHDYTEALQRAELQTLCARRTRNDLLFLYSIYNGFILCDSLRDKFLPPPVRPYALRNPILFATDFYRTNFFQSNIVQRLIRLANVLIVNVDLLSLSTYAFKKFIDSII